LFAFYAKITQKARINASFLYRTSVVSRGGKMMPYLSQEATLIHQKAHNALFILHSLG
jgi:hypothetical protein